VLAVAAGIGVLAMLFGGGILLRIAGDDAGAAQSRVPLMVIAVRMIGAAPLHGVGLNNFATALPEFVTPEYSRDWLYVVHNYYLQIAAETGVFGLLAFVAFLASVVRSAWAASRTLPNDLSVLALSVLAAVVARAVHMNVDLFGAPAGWEALVVVAALAAALLRQSRPPAGDRGSKRVLVPVDTTPP
jgi:O-antigen ligase